MDSGSENAASVIDSRTQAARAPKVVTDLTTRARCAGASNPSTRRPRYSGCGKAVRRVHDRRERQPWADHGSGVTREFELTTAYLAQRTDQTTVSALMRVAWVTVGSIVQRVSSPSSDANARRNSRPRVPCALLSVALTPVIVPERTEFTPNRTTIRASRMH